MKMAIHPHRKMTTAAFGLSLSAAIVLSACSTASTPGAQASGGVTKAGPYTIAVLAASSQNGYNQAVYQGVKEYAAKVDSTIKLKLLDGQFNSDTQLSQLQNVTSDSQYSGVIVVPNDGPTLGAAFPTANNIPVVTVLNPIGPNIDTMEPQVKGVISTVAVSPSDAAAKQAAGVVTYCEKINPCKVAIIVGNLGATLDVARRDAYQKVLSTHGNIKIVAVVQGAYDPDKSLTAISNVLQSTPGLNVILSNADQQTEGAQIALKNAGIDPSTVYLTGGGGTKAAVAAVRAGTWKADYVNFPVSMGAAAMEQLYNALTGKKVTPVVNADKVGATEPFANKETLDKTPGFLGEWAG